MQTATAVHPNGNGVTDYEPLIIESIRDGYRTLGGIKRRTGFPVHKDISSLLEGLIEGRRIHRQDNGTLTAYFLWDEDPIRFWLDGDGKVGAELAAGAKPEPPKAKQTGTVQPDPAAVEQLARDGVTVRDAAGQLGISVSVFKNYLSGSTGKSSGVREAWYRGKKGADPKPKKSKPIKAKSPVARATEPKAVPEPPQHTPAAVAPGPGADVPVHARHVTLAKGGQVVVGCSANVFDMTAAEIELVSRLGALLQDFEAAR